MDSLATEVDEDGACPGDLSVTMPSRVFTFAVFFAITSSKPFCAVDSSELAFSRSAAKVSYMSFRIPVTVADCGEYLERKDP